MINAEPPTPEEYQYVKKISVHDPRVKVRQRAQIMLLSWSDHNITYIEQQLGCDRETIQTMLKLWNSDGIGSLVTWRRTDSWKTQYKRRMAVDKLVTTAPHSLDLVFNTWSLKKLSAFFTDLLDYPVSPTTIWRDLKILGVSYQSTKDTFILKPPNYDLKRAELRLLEHLCPASWRIIYLDEKGPVHAIRYSGHCWSFERPQRDVRQESTGQVKFLGGYDPKVKKLVMVPMESQDSEGFCDALPYLRLAFLHPPYSHLIFLMDNDTSHNSIFTRKFLDEDPQLAYAYLPTYSPELNPIEICFQHYTKEKLENGTFTSKEQIIEETIRYAEYYGTLRQEIYA